MEDFKTYKLEELTIGKGEYGIGASAVPFDSSKYTYLRITDINDDGTLNKQSLMSVDDINACNYILKKNDIVFARTGNSTGRSYFYDGSDGVLVYAGFLIKFSIDDNKVNPRILKYYTHSKPYFDWVHSFDTGGTRGNINAKTYGTMPIILPPRKIQDKIVSILKSLDDKIELNRRINENLEQQAQALFKSWFVDFEPFKDGKFVDSELGMIPEGWKVGTIGDYSKIRSGFAFKSSWWTNKGVKIVKIKNISSSGNLDMNDCSYVSKENTLKAKEFSLKPGDLLIAMTGATIGKFCIVPILKEEMYVNQRVGRFFLGEEPILKVPFIYGLLKSENIISQIINKGQGSAQPNISANDIETISIILPPEDIISKYNELVSPYFSLLIKNLNECDYLANLRDTLLPKLMSGELKLSEMETKLDE